MCHRTFGGHTGFDAHRKDGVCLPPEEWSRKMEPVVDERFGTAIFRQPRPLPFATEEG